MGAACGSGPTGGAAGSELSSAHAREVLSPSVDEAVAASDLVIVGHVTGVADGRTLGNPSEATVTFAESTVQIDEVLHGDPAGASAVIVEDTAAVSGQPRVVNDARPTAKGDTILIFLVRKDGEVASDGKTTPFRLVSTQTRFFLRGDDDVESNYRHADSADASDPSNAWVEELAQLRTADAIARVRDVGHK
jgi:hypothetical protein